MTRLSGGSLRRGGGIGPGIASVLLALMSVASGPLQAQGAEPASAAKKELAAKVIRLQQAGIENMGRSLAEAPAQQLVATVRAILGRLPPEKREPLAREIEGDLQKYFSEAVPIVRQRAAALAPATLSPMIEERFTEEELRQLVAILESPVSAKYQALAGEMQRSLGTKVVADTRSAIEPKVKALEESIQKRLRAAAPQGN